MQGKDSFRVLRISELLNCLKCFFNNNKMCCCFFLLQCLAHVEAFIDFSEGELIEDGVLNQGASSNRWKEKKTQVIFSQNKFENFLFAWCSLVHNYCIEILLGSKCCFSFLLEKLTNKCLKAALWYETTIVAMCLVIPVIVSLHLYCICVLMCFSREFGDFVMRQGTKLSQTISFLLVRSAWLAVTRI